jgi:hypothetical protein
MTDKLEDNFSEFDIDTSTICREEAHSFSDSLYKNWKKVPESLLTDLEGAIQKVLLRNVDPTISRSNEEDNDGYM